MKIETSKTEFKRIGQFIELLIWFLIFLFIAYGIYLHKAYKDKNFNRYQIFLQDVDGIIEGSPVRMLGIQVGYVKHIKIVNDLVFVDFVITEKNMKIPKGSTIAVEFTGLGGSKSLEIYTPKEKVPTDSYLIIQQPRRLGAAISLLDTIFEKISAITYTCTSFTKSLNFDFNTKNNNSTESTIDYLKKADGWIDKMQYNLDNKKKK